MKTFGWRGAFGIAVSAVVIWWLVAKSGIDWSDAWRHIRGANVPLLLLAGVAATAIFPLRAKRWQIILDPVAPHVSLGKLWRAVAIGMMGNNVLPLRGGEIARAYALSREEPRVPFTTGLASLFVDRVFDGVAVLLLLFASLLDPLFVERVAQGNSYIVGATILPAAALLVALTGLYVLVFFPAWCIGIATGTARRIAPRFEVGLAAILTRFAEGLSVLRSPSRFFAVLFWSVLHWLVNALAFWIGFRAVGLDAPFSVALFVQGIVVIGVAVPSSPGFVGVFEAAAVGALTLYGYDKNLAAAWAVAFHAVSYVPVTAFGLFYAGRLGLHLGDLQAERK